MDDCGKDVNNNSDKYNHSKVHWGAKSLNKRLRQLLLEEEIVTAVEVEARHSLTARQLAASGGNIAIQRLLA